MILKNCTFFNENFEKEYGDIEIENGKIKQIGILDGDGKDMTGKIIIPGFIDVHIHGCAGGDALRHAGSAADDENGKGACKARCNVILPNINDTAERKA